MDVTNIIIVGGGIGGLAAERAPEIKEIGAGLIITPNARRALQDLGVDQALEAASSCVPVMYTCDYATREVIRAVPNEQFFQKYGMGILQVHRADLHGFLLEAVRANDPACLHAGHEFVGLDQDATTVSVRFGNGACHRADAVIGADGNASAVRSLLFPGEATNPVPDPGGLLNALS
jgi:salicylate hydroxylase